jgi:hypothetical protein
MTIRLADGRGTLFSVVSERRDKDKMVILELWESQTQFEITWIEICDEGNGRQFV